jgi:glycosyltransferase involved in cell wall biosynthesis
LRSDSVPARQVFEVKFSIITPSFRQSDWLRLCVASVHDQGGVELEHIVQDAGSDDGTLDWLVSDQRVKAVVEKDDGMYDAINRGFRRASGDILAYLNCDEQYLPGALTAVQEFFERRPEIEVALAGTIVVDKSGNYLCHRHSLLPDPRHFWFRFSILTSAVFLRRKVIHERGTWFDTRWRALGDFHWIRALLEQRVPMAVFDHFTSVFADTGDNLCLTPNAIREYEESLAMAPRWVRTLRPLWILHHRLRRLAAGHFSLRPTSYSIYTAQSPDRRKQYDVAKPTAVWWNRLSPLEAPKPRAS